ncbi:MAG TPA: dual specificity protein phosphatase family protein [Pyrinomonadaceae bacterium]|nr:dual specificity protein phosphatase family protein [Pyrinomonadaceae bacterium]
MRSIQQRLHNSKGLAAAGILLMLALTGVITTAQKVVTPPGIKNFGKVNDNYFRGSQPDRARMAALKAMGIKTIVDLRKDYVPEARQWATELGLNYYNLPLKPSKAATKEQTEYFLSLVNDPANGPVYVHCKGGRHRTGALTAAYRISHDGWTAEQAYEEMKKYDFNDGLFGGPAAQKKFVFEFYEQQKKSVKDSDK